MSIKELSKIDPLILDQLIKKIDYLFCYAVNHLKEEA